MDMTTPYDTPSTPDTEDDHEEFKDELEDYRDDGSGYYGDLNSGFSLGGSSVLLRSASGGTPSPRRTAPRQLRAFNVSSPLRKRTPRGAMSGSESSRPTPPKRPRGRPRKVPQPSQSVGSTVLSAVGVFVSEIAGNVFWMLKKPLAWLVALYLLAVAGTVAGRYLQHSIFSAMQPLCNIPGVGILDLPFCLKPSGGVDGKSRGEGSEGSGNGRVSSPNFPKFMDLQSSFEGVLENSAVGSVMAQDLKNSEVAVRDLNTLVKYSKLLCKDILSNRLEDFVAGAKSTSYSLIKFSSRVRGVVDMLIALDEYAIASLESIKAHQTLGPPSPLGQVTSLLLAPFRGNYDTARAERDILVNLVQAGSVMDTSIKKLILEAVNALQGLEDLDQKLMVIDEIVQKESSDIDQKNRDTLANIWTILGGNKNKLANLHNHLSLLSNLGMYRKKALAHISASLMQLQNMQANLEDLRDRMAQSGLMGEDGDWGDELPLEVYIQSIRKGVDRLSEGMTRAKTKEQTHMAGLLKGHEVAIKAFGENIGGAGSTNA